MSYQEEVCNLMAENGRLQAEVGRLRAALKPFAEVPPHSPPSRRCLVADAGTGPYHFLQSDLDRAKEIYREHEQKSDEGLPTAEDVLGIIPRS